jgi:uncharacterized membrane protein YciS (DUF1049 family)
MKNIRLAVIPAIAIGPVNDFMTRFNSCAAAGRYKLSSLIEQ